MGREAATIFALASGAGRAAIAVLRVSGEDCFACVQSLCGRVPPPRRASLRVLRDGAGEVLDKALVLWLPGPGSYTGEDAAELHVHGGLAVVRGVSRALIAAGCRPAEPGEFTRRAFLHGRLDLLEAEGVANLVAAETEGQRRQALRQLSGEASVRLGDWADRLKRVLAWQEALIDFPDEDLPRETGARLSREISILAFEIEAVAAESHRGARVRDGLVFAVVGAPNVGKSSLVNALARRDVAIVAATPGTTRDTLEISVEVAGVPVTLVDTAGLREASDLVEAEGVRRALARAANADLVLYIRDAAVPETAEGVPVGALRVANKIDLARPDASWLGVSAATGAGLTELWGALEAATRRMTGMSGSAVFSQARHIAALEQAGHALRQAEDAVLPELCGEELRQAMLALGRVTGAVEVEDVLDAVFGAFCIGK